MNSGYPYKGGLLPRVTLFGALGALAPLLPRPKCAQIQKNMHTSGRDARRRRRRGIGKNHQKIKHTAVYSKKIHTFIGCRENYRKN